MESADHEGRPGHRLDSPSTPFFGATTQAQSILPSPATPTPANLIFAQRIRQLSRGKGDVDDSPLISGRPPPSRLMFERASSTTPTVPPPANLLRQSSTSSLPLDAESLHEANPIAPAIVISPTLSRSCTSAAVICPSVVNDSQDVTPPLDLASLSEPLHEINSPLSQTSDLSLDDLAPQSSQSGVIQQFKARPTPSTTYVPEHKVRQSRASLLRAGIDPESLSTSENSKDGPSQHVPTDFTAVPGHKRSRSNLRLSVASIKDPAISPRENRASLIRQGKLPPPSFKRVNDPDANKVLFANTPGHRRAETISVLSTQPPANPPRQTRASSLRIKDDVAHQAYLASERQKSEQRIERMRIEDEKKRERRMSSVVLPKSLQAPAIVPQASKTSLASTGSDASNRLMSMFRQEVTSSVASTTSSGRTSVNSKSRQQYVNFDVVTSIPASSIVSRSSPASVGPGSSLARSLPAAPLVPSVASLQAPSQPVRQTRAALLRSGVSTVLEPAVARVKKTKEEIFEGIPGHKRRQSIQVSSTTSAPDISPRQNRAALLRSGSMSIQLGKSVAAGLLSSSPAPARPTLRPASATGGSFSSALSSTSVSSATLSRLADDSNTISQAPPSSFRSSVASGSRSGAATPNLSRPSSRVQMDACVVRPSSAARTNSSTPAVVPRENRASELRRLKRASVAF